MITTMTALEEGIITPGTTVHATGQFEEIKPSPKCWIYPQGTHGYINVVGAIAQSCNYFFYEMGYKLGQSNGTAYDSAVGLEKMEKYATELGLNYGARTTLFHGKCSPFSHRTGQQFLHPCPAGKVCFNTGQRWEKLQSDTDRQSEIKER